MAPRGRDVARAIPSVSEVHVFDKRGADRGLSGLRRVGRGLRARGFRLAIVPHQSPRSALVAVLAGVPERVGFSGRPSSLLYTRRVAAPRPGGFLAHEAALAQAVGAGPQPMRLVARPEDVEAALSVTAGAPFAALCIGSEWQTKIWPPERFAALAVRLTALGLVPVLLGGPREKAIAQAVMARARCLDTVGNSVAEALGLLSLAKICVGGDTGLVHAARALGTPAVALFGPTPSAVHDFGPRERVVSLGLACSPCSAHGTRVCPLGHHRCMRDLDEERVLAACEAVL